jgi:hypothetical protein
VAPQSAYLVDQACVVSLLADNNSDFHSVFRVSHTNYGLCEIQITGSVKCQTLSSRPGGSMGTGNGS